jgi:hypothetical protein
MITEIEIDTDESAAQVIEDLALAKGDPKRFANELITFISRLAGGLLSGSVACRVGDVKATGDVTCEGVQSTKTVTVAGVELTAVASGAAGPQFNVGVKASLEVQDLTYTAVLPGVAGNSITIAYIGGGTAGSEVVTVDGTDIEIEIEDGVSTATQVKAAYDAESDATDLATVAVTGTGGDAQVVAAADALEGGVGSDALTAESLAEAINDNVSEYVVASADDNVVELVAVEAGELGNVVTLASSDGGQLAVSDSTLTGGDAGTAYSFNFR